MGRNTLRLDCELAGHQAGVECMALSADGHTLLSGDDDAMVIVWNLTTGEITQKISCVYHGPISAITWININDVSEPAFVFGCADGSMHLYKRKMGGATYDFVSMESYHETTIESLAFDRVHCRLASVGGGIPQVWKISAAGIMSPIALPMDRRPVIARNVFFCDEGASIVVCYLESHEIICFSIEPWGVKWSKSVPTRIGNSFLCSDDGLYIFITNLVNGVDQYRFPSLEKVQTFPHAIESNFPLQVSTIARGSLIVCGGDNGFARVFDRRTGQLTQRLEHDKSRKQIPIIATYSLTSGSLIATGESGVGESRIRVWKESGDSTMIPTPASAFSAIRARLNSGLTGMQAIIFGVIAITCWHILCLVGRAFFDVGGFFWIGRGMLLIWKLISSASEFYGFKLSSAVTATANHSPPVLIVTQTAFATVTSILTTLVEVETNSPIPSRSSEPATLVATHISTSTLVSAAPVQVTSITALLVEAQAQ